MPWSLAAPAVTKPVVLLDTALVAFVGIVGNGAPVDWNPVGADEKVELEKDDPVADGVELGDGRELADEPWMVETLEAELPVVGDAEVETTVFEEEVADEAELSVNDDPELEIDADELEADGEAEELELVLSMLLLKLVASLLVLVLDTETETELELEIELELVSLTLLVLTVLLEDVVEAEPDESEVLETVVELAELEVALVDEVMIMSVTEVPVCCPEVTAPGVEVMSAPGAVPVVGVVAFVESQKSMNVANWLSRYVLSEVLLVDWSYVSIHSLQLL